MQALVTFRLDIVTISNSIVIMRVWIIGVLSNMLEENRRNLIMTMGEKIKRLRNEKGFSQEKRAEKLNVSRSAVAKWEADGGIPEIDNLIQLSSVLDISLDELVGNTKGQNNSKEADKVYFESCRFQNQCCDIELTGWNDGVYNVYITSEDASFLYYYRYLDKGSGIHGMIGKKYITSVLPAGENKIEEPDIKEVGREFFCGKPVKIELAKREGLIRGFFDFRDDAYRNVAVGSFGTDTLQLQSGGTLKLEDITKIEELDD